MNVIPDEFIGLNDRMIRELNRRNSPVAQWFMLNNFYEYSLTPETNATINLEHYKRIVANIQQVIDTPSIDEEPDEVDRASLDAVASQIAELESKNLKNKVSDCRGGCTGSCSTGCVSSCTGTSR